MVPSILLYRVSTVPSRVDPGSDNVLLNIHWSSKSARKLIPQYAVKVVGGGGGGYSE